MTIEELNGLLAEVNAFTHARLKGKNVGCVVILLDNDSAMSAVGGNPVRWSDLIGMLAETIGICSKQIAQGGDERIPRPEIQNL